MASLRDINGRFMRNPNSVSKPRNRKQKCACSCTCSQPQGITHVAFVIDESGSMSHLSSTVNKIYEEQISSLKNESLRNNQQTLVSLITFSTKVDIKYINKPLNQLPLYTHKIQNMTSLCDGICRTIEELEINFNKNDAYLVIVLTDGIENTSAYINTQRMPKLLVDKQKQGNWTFVFHVPPGQKQECINWGVPSDNIREWEGTIKGLQEASIQTLSSLRNYYNARSCGQTASKSFFTANLNNINSRTLNQKLDDISSQCKVLNVDKEYKIQDFVEKHFGYYQPGNTYFQLTKPETINPNKNILILDINTNKIYGGNEARHLIGLEDNKICKVTPGNLSNYKIFCQSLSRNRILVRGTKVIIFK